MSRAAWIAMLAGVVVAAALAVTSWQAGWFGQGSGPTHASAPNLLSHVPSSLPPGGVSIADQVLTPWAHVPKDAMSAGEAIHAARHFSDRGYPAHALRAELNRTPVWLVTFTFPSTDVGQGGPGAAPVYVTHYSVAVNAVTGKFVRGFFES